MTIPKGLSPKQSAFAGFVASGLTQTEAYRKAYDTKGKDSTVHVLASRLMKKDHAVSYTHLTLPTIYSV